MALVIARYSDISDKKLMHYGVKGMKWGVWNEETKQRYENAGINVDPNFYGGGSLDELLNEANDEEVLNNLDFWNIKENDSTPDEDMKVINPYYEQGIKDLEQWLADDPNDLYTAMAFNQTRIEDVGYSAHAFNCVACSMVYDLRRRGFDVDAAGTANMSFQFNNKFSDYYVGAEPKVYTYIEDALSEMRNTPKGSRGVISGLTVNGGGHAIAWENEGEGGITFRDCQTGTKYSAKNLDKVFVTNSKGGGVQSIYSQVRCVRLDDKTPNYARLRADGIVSSSKNNKVETEKDRIRSITGYYNIKKRDLNRDIRIYEKISDKERRETLIEQAKEYIAEYDREMQERISKIQSDK